ncbi:MAG: ATP-binding cassette domain-containing protein [Bacteroidales bacterium]|nr:ATP-binding cassette domain-containing protein [Bacteroidales bacterium]
MTESMLKSLMKLFALLASTNVEADNRISIKFVESYLNVQFSRKIREKYLQEFNANLETVEKDADSIEEGILTICNEINRELNLRNKFLILISIIQFSKYFEEETYTGDQAMNSLCSLVETIAGALRINEEAYLNCKAFINDKFYKVPIRSSLLVISDSAIEYSNIKHLQKENLEGRLFFLEILRADLYIFYYTGRGHLELGGKVLFSNHIYFMPRGASIKSDRIKPVYFNEIVSSFRLSAEIKRLTLRASGIEYFYPNSSVGIHEINLDFHSGELAGIMGSSGTGKSTLLNILNGNLVPDKGEITLNSFRFNHKNSIPEGLLGFVPQNDLLIEELTVYENLNFNARLCLGNIDNQEINNRIEALLKNLDLYDIRNLKVGSPLNKFISGGQRKRLNIALELIRDPYVLFVDEPTSGLSSTDSENVMQLLKDQALMGRIVIVSIHQPSSGVFRLFNNIIILDKGGYTVFNGNPLDSISFLKNVIKRADAEEIECDTCGNIQTDAILQIIESRTVNEFGEYTKKRLLEPREWYNIYREKAGVETEQQDRQEKLPESSFSVPSCLRQFQIYSLRNLYSKLANHQYMSIALAITPVLAIVLGFFTKYMGDLSGDKPAYDFSMNENIPAYIFMSVILVLFVGLIISAEEIFRDRNILTRESFLNLSRLSYLNSKVGFLFALSAIQVLVYILIGNTMLSIKGLNLYYWIILFSTSCFAVMLGLNISSALKSAVSIYISIPFIMIPLLLFSGAIVKFDKLHFRVAGEEYVPFIGEIMASRWPYEALVVCQFMKNDYEKHFYSAEKQSANDAYKLNILIPEIENRASQLENLLETEGMSEETRYLTKLIRNAIKDFDGIPQEVMGSEKEHIDLQMFWSYLSQYKDFLRERIRSGLGNDQVINKLIERGMTQREIVQLKKDHHNREIENLVKRTGEFRKIVERNGKLIRKDTPIFQPPDSKFGRAQFYAGSKFIGNLEINTMWFNVLILWIMTLFLYIALYKEWLGKLINITGSKRQTVV